MYKYSQSHINSSQSPRDELHSSRYLHDHKGNHKRVINMPTYIYKNIETGEIYELKQSMKDDAYTTHPETGVAIKRMVVRPAIAFKGSGFYANDSRSSSAESGAKSSTGSTGSTGSEKRTTDTAQATTQTASGTNGATKSAADAGSSSKKSDSGASGSSAKTGSAE